MPVAKSVQVDTDVVDRRITRITPELGETIGPSAGMCFSASRMNGDLIRALGLHQRLGPTKCVIRLYNYCRASYRSIIL